MTNPAKRKGDASEREVAALLSDLLGVKAQRALGAGRKEDVGDVFGIPDTVIQVANHRNLNEALRLKLPATVAQQENAGATFGALFLRRTGGGYVVCMTPDQFAALWREAQPPVRKVAEPMNPHVAAFLKMKFPAPKEKDYKPW